MRRVVQGVTRHEPGLGHGGEDPQLVGPAEQAKDAFGGGLHGASSGRVLLRPSILSGPGPSFEYQYQRMAGDRAGGGRAHPSPHDCPHPPRRTPGSS
ncbi:hypothetical protein GCM10009780_33100 [Actinomadura alba]